MSQSLDTIVTAAHDLFSRANNLLHEYDADRDPHKLKTALRLYNDILKFVPEFSDAHVSIANVFIRKFHREVTRKTSMLDTFLRTKPRRLSKYLTSARKAADKAIELNPHDPNAHLVLGRCYSYENKLDEAICEMERAIELNPSFATAHYDLGRIYLAKRNHEKAKTHLQVATTSEYPQISSDAKKLLEVIKTRLITCKPLQ